MGKGGGILVTRRITDSERMVLLESLKAELEKWWRGHPEMRNYAVIGRRAGVSAETTRRVFQGSQLPSQSTSNKLKAFVDSPTLDICATTRFTIQTSVTTKTRGRTTATQVDDLGIRMETKERISRIESLRFEVVEEIEFFKKGTPAERELLKSMLNPSDVGYVTSLLRAFFDEDVFQQWIILSQYKMKGGES